MGPFFDCRGSRDGLSKRINEANPAGAAPSITLGVKLEATQKDHEGDSFGSDYDKKAEYDLSDPWDGSTPAEQPDSITVDKDNYIISIYDAEGLAYLNTLVNDSNFINDHGSKWKYTIELNADINLLDKPWTPISLNNFVAFEGNGHTIKNLYVNGGDNAGLFAITGSNDSGTIYIRDLTIDGAKVSGKNSVGVVAGSSPQGIFENVTVINATVIGEKYVGGIFGHGNGGATNCTVKNSKIVIPADGIKEAGGLIGYLSNDGIASTENKIISGNLVENVTVIAPTIASGLVAQPNSSNKGGAIIVVENNTMKNVTVMTGDETAALYVSNNVSGKSEVKNNTAENCKALTYKVVDDTWDALTTAKEGDVVIMKAGTHTTSGTHTIPSGVTIMGEEGKEVIIHQNSAAQDDIFNCVGDVVIRNITFESNRKGYAVAGSTKNHDTDGDITIIDCTFKGLASEKNWGVYKNLNGNLTIQNCTFDNYNNAICGVNNGGDSKTIITGCTFTNINGEAIGYVASSMPVDFEAQVIADNTGLTAENVIGY
ncbi:MAG: hypothetical protein IJD39_02980 [Clostridia bacterium]|nr:hypothetical protein [Clostridia bacterium]